MTNIRSSKLQTVRLSEGQIHAVLDRGLGVLEVGGATWNTVSGDIAVFDLLSKHISIIASNNSLSFSNPLPSPALVVASLIVGSRGLFVVRSVL